MLMIPHFFDFFNTIIAKLQFINNLHKKESEDLFNIARCKCEQMFAFVKKVCYTKLYKFTY